MGFALSKSSSMAPQPMHVTAAAATALLEKPIEDSEADSSLMSLEAGLGAAGSMLAVGLLARSFFKSKNS